MPPLRDRLADIPELAAYFIRQSCTRFHLVEPRLPQRELERARQYSWPGNVRELQNVVERAVILAQGGSIALELPTAGFRDPAPQMRTEVIPEAEWRRREKENIVAALEKCDYRISGKNGAAELLGVNAATLTSRLKSLGIPRNKARAASFSR